jgi:hypothetical protein
MRRWRNLLRVAQREREREREREGGRHREGRRELGLFFSGKLAGCVATTGQL